MRDRTAADWDYSEGRCKGSSRRFDPASRNISVSVSLYIQWMREGDIQGVEP